MGEPTRWVRRLPTLVALNCAVSSAQAQAPCLDCIRPELRGRIDPAVRYERVAVAEDENGLPLLRLAADLVRAPQLPAGETCGRSPEPADVEVLERNRLSLWLLDEALARPRFQWAPFGNGESLYPYRQALLLELLSARAKIAEMDAAGAARDVETAFLLAQAMADGDAEIVRLFLAAWAERSVMAVMRELAADAEVPERSLARFLDLLGAPPTVCDMYARAWRVEFNTFWIPSVQDLEAQGKWRGPPLGEAVQRASEDLAAHLALCGSVACISCARRSSPDDFDPAAWTASVSLWSMERAATRSVLALRFYERRFGSLPPSLGEVVSAGLLPAEPRDEMTGLPLVYDREAASVSVDLAAAGLACDPASPLQRTRLTWKLPGTR